MENVDYVRLFGNIVTKTADYIVNSGRKAMILGVSGGIDSTLVSIIGREVSKLTGIPLLGRSLPIKNKDDEKSTAFLVGKAFYEPQNFKVSNIEGLYHSFLYEVLAEEEDLEFEDLYPTISEMERAAILTDPIARGNIQARLRMNYLYNLAGIRGGLVLDTDNLTEHNLGFFTLHGDEGDFNPIGGLWKSEVYDLSRYLLGTYDELRNPLVNDAGGAVWYENAYQALAKSLELVPTDGNGVSESDLSQIGGSDYYEVDAILRPIVEEGKTVAELAMDFDRDVVEKIWNRHKNSEFKRKARPFKITRTETFM